ncbi:MAG TPA: PIN domain-containing protein [Solirubrobacterales bacterium]|nr:PIN domain-containing protein [Solirubrobacterales bacterium]
MTLLDANALIAVVRGEPAMEQVLGVIREESTAMTTVNIAEVYDSVARKTGLSHEDIGEVIEPLLQGPIAPISVDVVLARRAAEIRSAHYHRKRQALSLADCVLLAAAGSDRIATADPDVLTVAAQLGIETIELPPSSG